MINWDKNIGQSLTASSLLLLSWQIPALGQESNTDDLDIFQRSLTFQEQTDIESILALELASEPENQSSQFCPIKTKSKQEATASEYLIPLVVAVGDYLVSIKVKGSTVLSFEEIKTEIDRLFQPETQQKLTLAEFQGKLDEAAERITNLYFQQGYFNSKAIDRFPTIYEQRIVGEINVIEGGLDRIEVKGRKRLNLSYICNRIGLGVDTPLNFNQLEDQLRLLRVNPLFKELKATLGETGKEGKSNLVVELTEANPLIFALGTDNYSPPSVGSVRFGGSLGYGNVTGLGDTFAATYYRSTTGGSDNLDVSYQVPLNAMNGTLLLRAAPEWRKITQSPFDQLDIKGDRQRYEITYRQPFVRTPRNEFALSLGFSYQDDETSLFDRPFSFTFGPENGESRTRTIQFGQDYTRRDNKGAWSLRSQFNFGVGLFDATNNESPTPDGNFFSWQFQGQRVQVLTRNNFLVIQGDLQLTPDALLPNQQFIIGGGQSVRGYRQNVRSGDNGFRFSIEDQITLARRKVKDSSNNLGNPIFQLAPFIDLGYVWNKADNPNRLADQQFLIGAGLGMLWEPIKKFQIRLDYGVPIIDLDDRGDDVQDNGFYFSVNYRL